MSLRVTITNTDGDEYVVANAIHDHRQGVWLLADVDDTGDVVRVDQMLDGALEWDQENERATIRTMVREAVVADYKGRGIKITPAEVDAEIARRIRVARAYR